MTTAKECAHLDQMHDVTPSGDDCKECTEQGMNWVSLRLCRTCGHVGCCDSSQGKHATQHFQDTGHPIMAAYKSQRGDWSWCYIDELRF